MGSTRTVCWQQCQQKCWVQEKYDWMVDWLAGQTDGEHTKEQMRWLQATFSLSTISCTIGKGEYWPKLDKLGWSNKILYHHTQDYYFPLGLFPVQSFQMSNLIYWIQLLSQLKKFSFLPPLFYTNLCAISVKHTKWWAGIAWKLEVARLIKIKINPYPMPSLNRLLWYCGDCLDAQWKWEEWCWY